MFEDAAAFDANITGWETPKLTSEFSSRMFIGATAWLDKYERDSDGAEDFDDDDTPDNGPPNAWALKMM
jgi:hypothetical protein